MYIKNLLRMKNTGPIYFIQCATERRPKLIGCAGSMYLSSLGSFQTLKSE